MSQYLPPSALPSEYKCQGDSSQEGLANGDIQEYFGEDASASSNQNQVRQSSDQPCHRDDSGRNQNESIRNKTDVPLDRGEQRLLKLLDRYERRCRDDEFEMTEILELVKLQVQKTMTGEEGAYLLYLVKKFKIDVPIYKKALR